MSLPTFTLYAGAGTGSAIVEGLLTLCGCPYRLVDIPFNTLGPGTRQEALKKLNPLAQVPTLVLPTGQVMTETAAIAVYLGETYPESGLLPPVGSDARAACLSRLVFFGAALYSTFTYGDFPGRWVDGQEAGKRLRETTDAHREMLWTHLEQHVVGTPWFLGDTFSALDVFVHIMIRWRPGFDWFAVHCPRLHAVGTRLDAHPQLAPILHRNMAEA